MPTRALFLLLAVALAFALAARFYDPFPGDASGIAWVQSWENPVATPFMRAISLIGTPALLFALMGVATISLVALGRRREALAGGLTIALMGLAPLWKALIERARPPADLLEITSSAGGYGFPSGHAFQSLLFLGFLIYLASVFIERTAYRRCVQASLLLLIGAIGLSRVYLGAHWPSDVLGAYLLGCSMLALMLRACHRTSPSTAPQ